MAGCDGGAGHCLRTTNHRYSDPLADIASFFLSDPASFFPFPDTGVVTQSESDIAERSSHSSSSTPVDLQHDAKRPTACARLAYRPNPDGAR